MEDQKNVCRICLNVIQNNTFTYVDDENGYIQNVGSIRDLIQFCIPELDLYVSTNPIVCHQCLPSMVTVYNFKSKCLHIEGIIRNYIVRNNLQDYNFVNLNCVIMDEMKIKNQLVETKIKQYMSSADQDKQQQQQKEGSAPASVETIGEKSDDSMDKMEEALVQQTQEHPKSKSENNMQDVEENHHKAENITVKVEKEDSVKEMELEKQEYESDNLITDIKCEDTEFTEEAKPVAVELTQTRMVIKIDRAKLDMESGGSSSEVKLVNNKMPSEIEVTTQVLATPSKTTPEEDITLNGGPLFKLTSNTSGVEKELVVPVRLYQCKPCNFVTTDIKNVSMHNNMYHSSGFLCTHCPFSTNQLELLHKHVTSAHGFENNADNNKDYNNRSLHSCEMCTFKTNIPEMMSSHKVTHANNIVTLTPTQFSNLYNCPQCAYKTTGLFLLNKHIETKHEKKSEFQCENCAYSTKDKSNFRKHVFTHGTKPMQCTHCNYKCVSPYQMRRHVKKNHEKVDLSDYKLSIDYFSKVNGNLNLTGQLSA